MVWMLILEPFYFNKLKRRWPFIYFKFFMERIVPLKIYSIIYSHQQYQSSRLYQLRTSRLKLKFFMCSALSFFGFKNEFFCNFLLLLLWWRNKYSIWVCIYTFFFFKRFITRQLFSYNLIKITVVVDRPFAELERHLQCFRDFFFHFEWRRRTSEEHWLLEEFLLRIKEKENIQEITLELDY